MFTRLVINIIRKDWLEHWKLIALLTAGSFVPLLVTYASLEFREGMLAGILVAASYGYAFSCFMAERQRGTLQLLLSLPLRSFDLVIAKYASMYSMVLFTANVPGLFIGDVRAVLVMNAFALLLSTICMAATVISDKPWAPVIPLWIVCVGTIPATAFLEKSRPFGSNLLRFLNSHVILAAAFAILLPPMIAVASALWFHRKAT